MSSIARLLIRVGSLPVPARLDGRGMLARQGVGRGARPHADLAA